MSDNILRLAAACQRYGGDMNWREFQWMLEKLAAEDAGREGQEDAKAPPCLCTFATADSSAVVGVRGTHHDRRCHMYGLAPVAATPSLPPLDPALVEECESAAWQYGVCNRQALMAALTHYRERVEKPLREELRLIDEAAYGHHVPEERQVGLLYRVCRLRSSVEQLTDDAAKHVEKMRGQRQHNRDVNRALTIRDAELSTSRAEADRLRAELDRTREELSSATNLLDNWKHDSTVAWAEADRLRGELNQYDERGHEAKLEIDRLRGELARANETIKALAPPTTPQPTDEERQRWANTLRRNGDNGMLEQFPVKLTTGEADRIATLLEEPPRRHARKSLGRRFVLRFEDGEISTRTHYDLHSAEVCASAAGAEIIACDLVPVAGEK